MMYERLYKGTSSIESNYRNAHKQLIETAIQCKGAMVNTKRGFLLFINIVRSPL